jgi:hypothetical protein
MVFGTTSELANALNPDRSLTVHDGSTLIRQVGLMFDSAGAPRLQLVGTDADGDSVGPVDVEVTWREGVMHVGRVLLPEGWTSARLTGAEALTWLLVETHEQVVARPDWPTAAQMPMEVARPVGSPSVAEVVGETGLATVAQAATLPSFVVTRSAWGARNPGKVCGTAHTPRLITIHHTVTPTSESNVPSRLRGIQAYHIDSNGWCDVGYHFLVGQDGRVYQGISSEERTGIHVGGNNTNNVGVSYIGTYTTDIPNDSMFDAGGQIVRWLSDTFSIPLNRDVIKGHRQYGSTGCPGDALYPRLQRIIDEAAGTTTEPPPEPVYAVTLDARWSNGQDVWTGGSSAGIADVFEGDELTVEFLLTNDSDTVIRGVELGYWFEEPWLRATNWRIESDHPAYDRSTFGVNSADSDAGNPARDGLGQTGRLVMHAFSPRETKRVVVTLVAGEPSIGRVDQPDARVWVRNISDVYGVQSSFDAAPSTNRLGRNVNDYAELDVLATQAWFFDERALEADVEGWTAVTGAIRQNGEGMASVAATDGTPTLESPLWTSVDTAAWKEVVLVVRGPDVARELELQWRNDAQEWSAQRSVRFRASGNPGVETLRLDLASYPSWTGVITGLRVVLDAGEALPGAGYDLDALWLQSAGGGSTSDSRVPPVTAPPVDWTGETGPVGDDVGAVDAGVPDAGRADAGGVPDAGADAGAGDDVAGPESDAGAGGRDGAGVVPVGDDNDESGGSGTRTTASTSSCSAGSGSGTIPWLLPLLVVSMMRRRRWRVR